MEEKNKIQVSESLSVGLLLALTGGFFDAYSYLMRGHIFANAQTGNMVLFGVHLAEGEWFNALLYFIPIFAFFVGVFIAEVIRRKCEDTVLHWRQYTVLFEMILVVIVGFLPQGGNFDTVANVLVSFICAMQVETFRKFHGMVYATTMCTGNLRSATQKLFFFLTKKEKQYMRECLEYFKIIGTFICGALIGSFFIEGLLEKSVWVALVPLAGVFLLMFQEEKQS